MIVYIDIGCSKLLLYKRLKKSILYINIFIITLIFSFICSLEEKLKKLKKKYIDIYDLYFTLTIAPLLKERRFRFFSSVG